MFWGDVGWPVGLFVVVLVGPCAGLNEIVRADAVSVTADGGVGRDLNLLAGRRLRHSGAKTVPSLDNQDALVYLSNVWQNIHVSWRWAQDTQVNVFNIT